MKRQTHATEPSVSPIRIKLGLAIFVAGFLSPLLIPVVKATQISTAWKLAISGALAVGVPEVLSVMAIAIMGKAGFNAIKAAVFKWFKKYAPPDVVGRTRYRVGLMMFVLPILFGWLAPYASHLIPGYASHRLAVSLSGDVVLISSLFILGGDFWDKVRSLFIHKAKANLLAQE